MHIAKDQKIDRTNYITRVVKEDCFEFVGDHWCSRIIDEFKTVICMLYTRFYYRQHCAQRKPPVFNLLRGRFWGFSPRTGSPKFSVPPSGETASDPQKF